MFDGLKQLGDLNQMRQQAQKIQQQLAAEKVEVTKQTAKGQLKIVLTGDQKVLEISWDGQRDFELEQALGEALYKSQMIAASKLQDLTGGVQ
ncbi:YbaB/EbfC family nucleoid-associated protein [Patescibacteria group bacterium]|nr:YbaB/EbfC family nucleoid-associated protein [Patescibacteria group bacterium]